MFPSFFFFFFNDTATTEIYTLSLHDALPISGEEQLKLLAHSQASVLIVEHHLWRDRKSTRLNSSHVEISYAVFCLKKKKKKKNSKNIEKTQNDDIIRLKATKARHRGLRR